MDRALIKSVAKLFADSYKPHNFGAFGKPTLQAVEKAIARQRLIYSSSQSGTIVMAAIFKILAANSHHTDFSGRRCEITRGSLYVNNLGAARDHVAAVLPSLVERLSAICPNAPFWIEIHEENRVLRDQLEKRLGFKYVMTKIKASSDIKGLYVKSSHFEELSRLKPLDTQSFIHLASDFLSSRELSTILVELDEYTCRRVNAWAQHYSHYNKRNTWTGFALRGFCPKDPTFLGKPSTMSRRWRAEHPKLLGATCKDTSATGYFKKTMEVLRRIPGPKERVRFMRLAATRGELGRHADVTRKNLHTPRTSVIRLHIPLVTHRAVLFESWGLRGEHRQMHLKTGGLYYLDNRKPHRVINPSPSDRIHIVVDVYPSPELEALMP